MSTLNYGKQEMYCIPCLGQLLKLKYVIKNDRRQFKIVNKFRVPLFCFVIVPVFLLLSVSSDPQDQIFGVFSVSRKSSDVVTFFVAAPRFRPPGSIAFFAHFLAALILNQPLATRISLLASLDWIKWKFIRFEIL